eukprot:COSAG02_NODE_248_length_27133_cov_45.131723_25_plen_507_part_00
MPGRAPRNGEQRLTGKQSREAGKYLRERWTPQTVWSAQEKTELTAAINARFAAQGEAPMYSVRKLEDWLSNARYRANCKQRAKEPESWSLERRAEARQKNRKKNRGAQQKQRRDETAAKLRAVPIATAQTTAVQATAVQATAVPVVGWAAAPRVQDIVMKFEAPVQPAEFKRPVDAGFGWPAAPAGRPRNRSEEFQAIRDDFERQRIGRTDEWASHRGYSSAPKTQCTSDGPPASDSAHFFEGGLNGERTTKTPDELVPTFLSRRGLPLPPVVDGDPMQFSPQVKSAIQPTTPEPLCLGEGMLQQDLGLDLDVTIDDLESDFDLDLQGLPVVEGHEPIDADVSAVSFDSSTQLGTAAAEWLSDDASQSTGMFPCTVNDNVDRGQLLPKADTNAVRSPADPDDMCLDTRALAPLPAESYGSATAAKTQPAMATATTVTASAVDIDVLATPGFLDMDLAKLLPAFDEGEAPACLPGKLDYWSTSTVQASYPGVEYHAHTLQAAHAVSH